MWKKIKPYVISVLIPLAVGGLSALLTRGNMDIYDTVKTPPLSPPMVLFPIVWGILYVLMGVGSGLVYMSGKTSGVDTKTALWVYGLQLIVNFFWSIIFFNMRQFLFAFIWIMLLWAIIIAMIVEFRRINTTAAWLQVPYLLWVTFAAYLTFGIYFLNG